VNQRRIWRISLVLVVGVFLSWLLISTVAKHAEGWFRDPTTNEDFSCSILISRNQYTVGERVLLKVRLTNHMESDVVIRDCAQHYPFYSFEVVDPTGRQLVLRKKLRPSMAEIKSDWRTINPGRIYDVEIDLTDWYDISQAGRYTIKANWCVRAKKSPYARESNSINIAVVPREQREIAELIYRATLHTKNGMSERNAQLKLVEMGDKVLPTLLEWVELEELNGGTHGGWNSFHDVMGVLSQIGSKEARKLIAQSKHLHLEQYRTMLLKRIDIWQSEDRFEKLIKALDEPRLGRKWVIFKLTILKDKRAIPVLEKIAQNDKSLDIRETAKDGLAHLKDSNIPMRYIYHRPSQDIELTLSADTYRIDEPIKINCNLIAGEYGSQTLVKFSKPAWHFLPWGFGHPNMKKSQPFIFQMQQKKKRRYDRLLPVMEPLDGYIDITKLGVKSTFTLKPEESRFFMVDDINKAFKITNPGEYRVYVSSSGYVVSNTVTINICAQE
jgi:hypothetical protein